MRNHFSVGLASTHCCCLPIRGDHAVTAQERPVNTCEQGSAGRALAWAPGMAGGWFGWKAPAHFLQGGVCSAQAFSINSALSFQVLANATVLKKPEGRKAGLGEALSVGSRNLQDQRRSQPLTWTYDPWLCPQPARRVPQDGLLPQAQTTLHELPSAQRPAPLPGSPPGSAAELQLSLEQVQEAPGGQRAGLPG